MTPIHPALAALARAAKLQDFEEVETALVVALRRRDWLRPEHRVGDPTAYMRHVLYVDPDGDFVMTAITWLPGQVSSKHGHHVWCLYGVAEGELTEERFRAPKDTLEKIGTSTLHTGELAELDLGGPLYHRVSNRTQAPLVTLHVYGVAARSLTTGINRIFAEE